jgi:uncharacterized protein YdcH (DUF465 family)
MSELDPFALGGRQQKPDLKSAHLDTLWDRHRELESQIDKLGASMAPEDEEEIHRLGRLMTDIEREICGRVATSVPDLIIQVTLLSDFIDLGSMRDDIDVLLAANIVTGLQRLAARSGAT